MSHITEFVNCETLQSRLTDHFGCDYTKTLKTNETALVSLAFSPINTRGTLQQQISSSGKLKDVKLVYTPRIAAADVSTSITPGTCTSTKEHGQLSKTYELDENVGVQEDRVVDTENLIRYCGDNQFYIEGMLLQMMEACIRKMDTVLAEDAISLAGGFGVDEDGVTDGVKSVSTRKASSTDLSSNFIEEIDFASENAGYCNAPLVLGFGEIYKAYKALRASNCCPDNGTNLALLNQLAGSMFIPSRSVATAFNDPDNFLTIDPGALQVLTYNRYMANDGGIMVVNEGTSKRTILIHPTLGIPFDYKADYSCGKWHFFVSLAFKTVGMPDDIYHEGDIYDGVTGINKYVVANS